MEGRMKSERMVETRKASVKEGKRRKTWVKQRTKAVIRVARANNTTEG